MKKRIIGSLFITTLAAVTLASCKGGDAAQTTTASDAVTTSDVTTTAPEGTTTSNTTTTAAPGETTTLAPEETTTLAPEETTTLAPEETTTLAPEETTTSKEMTEEEKKAEFDLMMSAFKNMENLNAYTVKSNIVMQNEATTVAEGLTTSNTVSGLQKGYRSYNPGNMFYMSDLMINGSERTLSKSLYTVEDGKEYKYVSLRDGTNEKTELSDGHIDYEGKFDCDDADSTLMLYSPEGEFTSFEDIGMNGLDSMETDAFTEGFSSLFVMPTYTSIGSVQVTYDEKDGVHTALIECTSFLTMDAPTSKTASLYAVTESTFNMEFSLKYTFTESAILSLETIAEVKLSGGDGTNTFCMDYSYKMNYEITDEFDEEDIPEKEDSYTDDPITNGKVNVYTPEGMYITTFSESIGSEITVSNPWPSVISFGNVYMDEEETELLTGTITAKTYPTKVYCSPTAKDSDKVFVETCYCGRKDSESEYSSSMAPANIVQYAPDAEGKIDFSTWTGTDSKTYTTDYVKLEYTNDPSENILNGNVLTVDTTKYYKIYVYGTQVPEAE